MNKKNVAIILELIPIVSVIVTFVLIFSPINAERIQWLTGTTTILALFGFVFFIVGRILAREEKVVRILGIFDWISMVAIVGLYVLAIFSFGL